MVDRKPAADPNDEADVARWRKRLRAGGDLSVDDQLRLQQYLDELKGNPPLQVERTPGTANAESIHFPGPPTAEAPLGQLGRYAILEKLGSGTFGAVYKARDRSLQRDVALKILNPEHAALPSERDRFEREAQAVSRLVHDHIVRVYDVSTDSEYPLPYFVMEFVNGRSLGEQQARRRADGQRPLAPKQAAMIVRHVALALTAAHECGLVHRDIKPSNILLDNSTGRAKITDFGLAREWFHPCEQSTHSGRIIGTLQYMSPEQVLQPDRVGPKSDLYNLGVVLFELLTGECPFRGTSPALLVQVVHDDPQLPRRLNPAIPRDLETICLKCLEKAPAHRFASAASLAEELQRFLAGQPITARPVAVWERGVKWARRRRAVAALMGIVMLVTAFGFAGVIWQWNRAEAGRNTARQEQAVAERARDAERSLRKQLERSDYFHRVALAHYEWLGNRPTRADQLLDACPEEHRGWEWQCLKRMFHPEVRILHGHTLEVRRVACSPDGRWIASVSGLWNRRAPGKVIVWDAHTGRQLRTFNARAGGFHGVAFSVDGQRLAAANPVQGVGVWNLATGVCEFAFDGAYIDVAFSPCGQLIAGGGVDNRVRLWNTHTGELEHELAGHDSSVFCVAFSPDGQWLASTDNRKTARIWSTQTGELAQRLDDAGDRCIAFTPDGHYLASCGYADSDTGRVKVWETTDWNEIVDQRVPTGPVGWLSISPDGRLMGLTDARHGCVRVWETTGRELRTLPAQLSYGVAMSPDGRTVVTGGRDGTVKLWDLTLQEPVIVRADVAVAQSLAFSPDGRKLAIAGGFNAVSRRGSKTIQIWDVTSTVNSTLEQSLSGHEAWLTSVAYRPDGKQLASADRQGEVKTWDANNGREVWSIMAHEGGASSVAFSPNSTRLASGGRDKVVRTWDAASGELIHRLAGHTGAVNQVIFSPDGRLVISASDDRTVRLWDERTGRELSSLGRHDQAIHGIALDSKGERLATAGMNGLINVWKLEVLPSDPRSVLSPRPSLMLTLRGHTSAVTGVSFSSDDTRLASISADQTVKIWDTTSGEQALTLDPIGHSNDLPAVTFSSDGSVLAAARKHIVTLWDAGTGTQVELSGQADQRRATAWHDREFEACEESGNSFGAIFHLNQLIALDPRQPTYYYRRGSVYRNDNLAGGDDVPNHEKARLDYRKAIELGGGLLMTGRGDHLTAPHIAFDQFNGFTIEAWVYGGFQGTIVAQGASGDPEHSLWLSPGQGTKGLMTDTYGWESAPDGKLHHQDSLNRRLPPRWNHLALVFDGRRQRLFVNGKLLKEKAASPPGPLDREQMLVIGGHRSGGRQQSSLGLLRSVRISRTSIYHSDFTPDEDLRSDRDTVLLYDFEKNRNWMTDVIIPDLSGHGNNGTLQNAWWRVVGPSNPM